MSLTKKIALAGKQSVLSAKSLAVLAAALACGIAMPAHAALTPLTLTLSEPSNPSLAPLVLTDTGNTGSISYFGTYGDFSTNFVIGLSNKLTTPTPGLAQLQVQSLDVTSGAITSAKTLSIVVSDGGFTFPGTTGQNLTMSSSLGGTLTSSAIGDRISFQSTATPAVGPVATSGLQTFTSTTAPVGTQSFTVPTVATVFPVPSSYSLQDQITATLTNAGETVNLSGSTTVAVVPEPVSVVAAVMAGGFGLLRRRPRRQV